MQEPLVSIVMPCWNEARFIEGCLQSVFAQDYPADRLELLVADGESNDGTREILQRLAAGDPRIRVIDNPARLQAPGMNAALRVARGDVIVRMDVHAEYAPDYVRQCVRVLAETGADNVGGAQRAKASTRFQKALCLALQSPLGIGGAKYRSADNEGPVDTVFLGAFRRSVFERVGLYDEGAVTNEDAEINERIRAAGGQIYLSRSIVVHYYPRDSMRSLAKQYYRYGRGRARTTLKHRRVPSLRPVAPFLMVAGAATLIASSSVQPFTLPALALYGAATLAEAARVCVGAGALAELPTVWAIFPLLHVSHGLGFAAGLWRYLRHPDWHHGEAEAQRLAPRPPLATGS